MFEILVDDELTPVGDDEKGAMDKSAQSEGSLGNLAFIVSFSLLFTKY